MSFSVFVPVLFRSLVFLSILMSEEHLLAFFSSHNREGTVQLSSREFLSTLDLNFFFYFNNFFVCYFV